MYNYNEMIFQFSKNKQVVVPYDMTTYLTIITAYKDATKSVELFALVD